jgi:arylsulfatase A-like enzyme
MNGIAWQRVHVPPNLLLILVDDLRADRLGCYGNSRVETPCVDQLAREGVRFERCFATCGWTLPSCASILTGRVASDHGLIHHDRRFTVPKIPGLLGNGWASFGVGNNGNLVPDTISREKLEAANLERRPEVWKHFGWQLDFEVYDWFHRAEADGPFEAFATWHAGRAADRRPWFAMVHTNIVHLYDEDRPWSVNVERFLGRDLHPMLRKFRDGPWIWQSPPMGMSEAQLREELLAKYDGGVAEMDRRLSRLFASVDLDHTVVVFVSDHGEGFDAAAGRVHHCGRMHDDLLRVPLIIHFPQGTPGAPAPGTVVVEPCSTIDVAPTLLAVAGHASHRLPGMDLRAPRDSRTLLAEDFGYLYLPPNDVAEPLKRYQFGEHDIELRSAIRWPTKEIRARVDRQIWGETYDLANDPLERVNLSIGPQGPLRMPEKEEGQARAWWRDRGATSSEASTLRRLSDYRELVRSGAGKRGFPKIERGRWVDRFRKTEPITFIVAVNDPGEFRLHAMASECFRSGRHQWIVVENVGNRGSDSISRLYHEAGRRSQNDLCFYVHQDVLFPPDWEPRLFRALRELEAIDPVWGVIGAVGIRSAGPGKDGPLSLAGHWSDPHQLMRTATPAEVQVLDELWLGFRRSRGIDFDPALPGFHCYGADICLAARAAGLRCWAIDAPVVHKLRNPDGTLVEHAAQSSKITLRTSEVFRADFLRSAEYVGTKWARFRPFASTSYTWPAIDA